MSHTEHNIYVFGRRALELMNTFDCVPNEALTEIYCSKSPVNIHAYVDMDTYISMHTYIPMHTHVHNT